MREGWGDDPFLCLFVGHEALRAKLHYDPGTLHWTTQYSCKKFHITFFSIMKHRVVGTCCKNLTQIRQLYCCCNSRGKEGSLKDGFYPKLSGSWGHCFHHHLLNSQHQVSVWRLFPKVSGLVSRCSQAAHHPPLRPPIIIICIYYAPLRFALLWTV